MDFKSLMRRDLQSLCKKNHIPANMTNAAMADALQALKTVEGIEDIQELLQFRSPWSSRGTASVSRARRVAAGATEVGETPATKTGGRRTRHSAAVDLTSTGLRRSARLRERVAVKMAALEKEGVDEEKEAGVVMAETKGEEKLGIETMREAVIDADKNSEYKPKEENMLIRIQVPNTDELDQTAEIISEENDQVPNNDELDQTAEITSDEVKNVEGSLDDENGTGTDGRELKLLEVSDCGVISITCDQMNLESEIPAEIGKSSGGNDDDITAETIESETSSLGSEMKVAEVEDSGEFLITCDQISETLENFEKSCDDHEITIEREEKSVDLSGEISAATNEPAEDLSFDEITSEIIAKVMESVGVDSETTEGGEQEISVRVNKEISGETLEVVKELIDDFSELSLSSDEVKEGIHESAGEEKTVTGICTESENKENSGLAFKEVGPKGRAVKEKQIYDKMSLKKLKAAMRETALTNKVF